MANDLKTMADFLKGLITEVDDEEKGRYVPANGVPPVTGGTTPPVPLSAPQASAVPQPTSVPQPAGYFDGMFPEVPKDIYAPQSASDFIDSSGAIASVNNPTPLVVPEVDGPVMRPTEAVPLSPKEQGDNNLAWRKAELKGNDIGELNPMRSSTYDELQKWSQWFP